MERAVTVTQAYNDFINSAHQYDNSSEWQHALEQVPYAQEARYELKRKLYRAVANVNILEGIRFYVSFACSFAFGELKLMEGSAKIISLIARDENQHLVITQNILKNWMNGDDPEMQKIAREEEQWTYKAFENAVNQEKYWAEYLFKDGSMIGLNDKLLQQYVEWIANRRMKAIGLKPLYDIPAKNTFLQRTIHFLGQSTGFLLRVFKWHHKKPKSNPTSSEESSKMSQKILSQDSNCKGNCKCNCLKPEDALKAYRRI
jgi:ribonucleoside-diphosphate reductase beta chain